MGFKVQREWVYPQTDKIVIKWHRSQVKLFPFMATVKGAVVVACFDHQNSSQTKVIVSVAVTPALAVVPTVSCNIHQSAKLPAAESAAVSTPVVKVPVTVRGAAEVNPKALAGAEIEKP